MLIARVEEARVADVYYSLFFSYPFATKGGIASREPLGN
jgi:hypothetical protein